ncbi:MAG: hypothetical protein ACRCZS_15885 [Chroococcidiopsis sp.]
METLITRILANAKGRSLTQSFYIDFCTQIKETYEISPPGKVRLTSVKRDVPNHWLIIQFNIAHRRVVDEVGIRWSGNEVTVDFLPGGATTNSICFIDDYGLRWVSLDYSKAAPTLSQREKADIERMLTNIYAIAQYYKPYLRFILGHLSVLKSKEKKV